MKNWQKDRNFRKLSNPSGDITYIITIGSQDVEVSEAVYTAYAKGARKMEYMERETKRDRVQRDPKTGRPLLDGRGQPMMLPEREVSLDKMVADDWDFPSTEPSPEDAVMDAMDLAALNRCLGLLKPDERKLIDALFFEGMTERKYSEVSGIARKTINDRKHRVLGKLKMLLLKK